MHFTSGKWIWAADADPHSYNQCYEFNKKFDLRCVDSAELKITADSRYRVSVNGHWINDGPGKAYPEHWCYDRYAIHPYLKVGINEIHIIVRYFGIGTFHHIPQQAGLIAELKLGPQTWGTDATWLCRPCKALLQWMPKISVQMEPVESFDATQYQQQAPWSPAQVIYEPLAAPWRDLTPRNSAPLTKVLRNPVAAPSAKKLRKVTPHYTVPVTQLANPGIIEANHSTSRPIILEATLQLSKRQTIDFESPYWQVSIHHRPVQKSIELEANTYAVRFYCNTLFGHKKDLPFPFLRQPGTIWSEWRIYVANAFHYIDNDRMFPLWFDVPEMARIQQAWQDWITQSPDLGKPIDFPREQLFMPDYAADFRAREPIEELALQGNPLTITSCEEDVIELCYDFGQQRCGYLDFEIEAPHATVVDLHLCEYIRPDGAIQHTAPDNRNGMRYRTHAGINRYCSLKRRAGRYLFISFQASTAPIKVHRISLIESTAAVEALHPFQCNDNDLTEIWLASERTLKLCMEDIFTDCPLYEQTLWIGDARNQALYAAQVYGNYSISERSLELGAQSLERFPIVGCQVPSTWDCLLPAWSFLWGIHVWEHYFTTGDHTFLERIWPAVIKNIEGAFRYVDESGLFSGQFWNLLEWAPMDQEHATVCHNNLLLLAALKSAISCAEVLGKTQQQKELEKRHHSLRVTILQMWDDEKGSYPDARLENGLPSPSISQHNSALALIAGAVPDARIERIRKNLLSPPSEMVQIHSPFAAQFLFEALLQLDEKEAIINSIRKHYQPMIAAGATTVWETYPNSTCSPPGFPTRSHCHAWSCGPLQFMNLILLGIEQTAPGGTAFRISPWLGDLQHASGAQSTPLGAVQVEWKIQKQQLFVKITAPDAVQINFCANASHSPYTLQLEIVRSNSC
jgi:hypothetical protein